MQVIWTRWEERGVKVRSREYFIDGVHFTFVVKMQFRVSVFQRLGVPHKITWHWDVDIQRHEAPCNKTCTWSRVATHSDVRQAFSKGSESAGERSFLCSDRIHCRPYSHTHTHAHTHTHTHTDTHLCICMYLGLIHCRLKSRLAEFSMGFTSPYFCKLNSVLYLTSH
jgi:hypothetical protein